MKSMLCTAKRTNAPPIPPPSPLPLCPPHGPPSPTFSTYYIRAPLIDQVADSLEKSTEQDDEYMISEKELLVNR